MSMYHIFYIKQMKLEVVQPIYVQKIMNSGNVRWLATEQVDILDKQYIWIK